MRAQTLAAAVAGVRVRKEKEFPIPRAWHPTLSSGLLCYQWLHIRTYPGPFSKQSKWEIQYITFMKSH